MEVRRESGVAAESGDRRAVEGEPGLQAPSPRINRREEDWLSSEPLTGVAELEQRES